MAILPLAFASYFFVPVWRGSEAPSTKALSGIWLPSASIAMPVSRPLADALPPVVNSPIPSFAVPFAIVFYTGTMASGGSEADAGAFFVGLALVVFRLFVRFSFLIGRCILV